MWRGIFGSGIDRYWLEPNPDMLRLQEILAQIQRSLGDVRLGTEMRVSLARIETTLASREASSLEVEASLT